MTKQKYSDLVFVSASQQKHQEYCALLGLADLDWRPITIEEPQNLNLEFLVEEKIKQLRPQLKNALFFVEHTGLAIDAWHGLPGGLTRQFMDTVGVEGICKMMQAYQGHERAAKAKVVIGYSYHPDRRPLPFAAEVPGTIAPEPRGEGNFGWDSIFIPDNDDNDTRTYAEMSLAEKNLTSMRRKAADKFAKYLAGSFELV